MQFDVVFTDTSCPLAYDFLTLEHSALGGTEASVLRIAEALAMYGVKVAIVQHNRAEITKYHGVFFLPISYIDQMEAHNHVMLRGVALVDKLPSANKISWHHDVPTKHVLSMLSKFINYNVTIVTVSKWHKDRILDLFNSASGYSKDMLPKVKYIYNPITDGIHIPKDKEIKYINTKLVWAASPHKGLDNALVVFKELLKKNPNFELHIFNPGYFIRDIELERKVINHGPQPCKVVWQHMSESLCVFYPTTYEETFGCIAAEANALHTPIAAMPIAGLNESVAPKNPLFKNTEELVNNIVNWYNGYRPKVYGQSRFKTSEVVKKWLLLLK